MRSWAVWGSILSAGLLLLAAPTARAQSQTRPLVIAIDLTGTVDPLSARYVERGLRIANDRDAIAALIRIDTPGGLDSSMRRIVQAVSTSRVQVICWVGPAGARAASAGAIILIGCPVAAMAPGTNVGAAHPVGFTGDVLSEKVTNDAAAYARALAQGRHRNADLAEKMVRQSVSVSANEALKLNAIDLIEPTERAVLEGLDRRAGAGATALFADARIERTGMTFIESLLHGAVDPNLAFLLFVFGLAGIVFEVLHPGISVPGILGSLAFLISLVLLGLLPVNIAGLALIVVGIVFFAFEVHIHTFGLAGALGVSSLLLGGLFLFNSAVPNARVSKGLVIGTAIAIALFFTFVVRAVVKARRQPPTPAEVADLIGAEGVVVRALDPTGIVRAQKESWSARSLSGPVPEGASVRVRSVQGLTLEVEPVEAPQLERGES